jgi:HEPN domain-containing protein
MFDIEKQVAYWRNGAAEDLQVAQDLIKRQRTRHGLFFLHLALEKLLKALVCRQTQDLAPKDAQLDPTGRVGKVDAVSDPT